ncbi:peroxidase-related enzyme [Rhodopirellula maiorica SM1]|uniref:Peroxidase-related enzyme n=1 Tax=Rhodopirellula maiorica SM1 TaxID=1265738 RepID=M5R904_9BACT|nr:carboxymuconolactone decarboxylase family protein [Rhodopirellula maiorica]EMI15845.1 peroxidase-related enzyme [Rhodopirellula maiorica SM1]
MSRINPIATESAAGTARELLGGVQKKLGMTPNMMATMAHSAAVLDAYLKFSGALGAGVLPAETREQIALTVGEANGCRYCLSAHSAIGKMVGLTQDQILDARCAKASDAKTAAILKLASLLVEKRGLVSDDDIAAARDAGVNDAEIAEVVANTSLNLFTNYFNHVADPEIDFPLAGTLPSSSSSEACGCHDDSCSAA